MNDYHFITTPYRFLISKLGNKAIGPINESGVNAAHVAASVG